MHMLIALILCFEVTDTDVQKYWELGRQVAESNKLKAKEKLAEAESNLKLCRKVFIDPDRSDARIEKNENGIAGLIAPSKKIANEFQKKLKSEIAELKKQEEAPPVWMKPGMVELKNMKEGDIGIPFVPANEIYPDRYGPGTSVLCDLRLIYVTQDGEYFHGSTSKREVYIRSNDKIPKEFEVGMCRIESLNPREIKVYVFDQKELAMLEDACIRKMQNK